jgi:hypothetical protein
VKNLRGWHGNMYVETGLLAMDQLDARTATSISTNPAYAINLLFLPPDLEYIESMDDASMKWMIYLVQALPIYPFEIVLFRPGLVWPEVALASSNLRPGQSCHSWLGFGLAWLGPGCSFYMHD